MEDNTLNNNNAQTNTPNPPEPAPAPVAAATPAVEPAAEQPVATATSTAVANAPTTDAPASAAAAPAEPAASAPESPAPLVDLPASDAAPAAPAAKPTPTAAANPFATVASLVDSAPITDSAPKEKQSPILNSAPIVTKKFDLKYLIPIIALGVATLGLTVYTVLDKVIFEKDMIAEAEQRGKDNATAAATTINVSSSSSTVDEAPTLIPFSSNNSLDGSGTYYLSADGPASITALGNKAATTVTIAVNWADAKELYSDLTTSTGNNNYTVNFNQGITQVLYAAVGEEAYYFFLLEDGTVEFLDIHQALLNKDFTPSDPVTDIEEVAKLLTATTNNSSTVLAQRTDGEYYDLSNYLQ